MQSSDLRVIIDGNNKVFSKNGLYTFSNINLIAMPDFSSNLRYVSNSIDYNKVRLVSNDSNIDEFLIEKIYFR
jgi:hypothetical protein